MLNLETHGVGVLRSDGPVDLPPVLCLPGILGDALIFEPLAELLSSRRRVYLADLPPGDPWRAAALIARRVEATGPFHVLTGSFGGLVCHKLPAHLVLSGAHVATLPSLEQRSSTQVLKGKILRKLPAAVVEPLYARHLRDTLNEEGVPADLVERILARPRSKDELIDRLRCLLDDEFPERPEERPTLWVLGESDEQAPWSSPEVHAHHSNAQVARLPGGHRPYATEPGPLLTRLEEFWSQVESDVESA
ncbi:MAG: pimeloyl-ACP methyl ester carboxylesterase [Cognaticolwellia sp.]|jgi:pimeloyl-ACP methyl ester carboxylesterase